MGKPTLRSALHRAPIFLLSMALSTSASASPTVLGIASASATAGSSPSKISFPVTRSGDTGYDIYYGYSTTNGTAVAGVDFTASASTGVERAAGQTNGSLAFNVAANAGAGSDKTFHPGVAQPFGARRGTGGELCDPADLLRGEPPNFVATADINGDGLPDLIVANNADNTVSVLLNTTAPGAAAPSFSAQETFATGGGPYAVAVADINGDGKPDLIVANEGVNTISVLRNTTAPGATTPSFAARQTFAVGAAPRSVAVADINGDGKADLIVANSGDNTVSVLRNTTATGATTLSFAAQQTFATGSAPYSVATGDINGDGKPDLVVANYSDNTVSVLLNTTATGATTASFAAQHAFATSTEPTSVTVADMNGDGKPDLIVANYLGWDQSFNDAVSILRNTTAPGAAVPGLAAQ